MSGTMQITCAKCSKPAHVAQNWHGKPESELCCWCRPENRTPSWLAHRLDRANEAFRAGAFYRDGNLVIPSYIYLRGLTERAAAEWRKRGFTWDEMEHEWTRAIPEPVAPTQITKANQIMSTIYGVPFGKDATQ